MQPTIYAFRCIPSGCGLCGCIRFYRASHTYGMCKVGLFRVPSFIRFSFYLYGTHLFVPSSVGNAFCLGFGMNDNTELGTNKCVPYRIGSVPYRVEAFPTELGRSLLYYIRKLKIYILSLFY